MSRKVTFFVVMFSGNAGKHNNKRVIFRRKNLNFEFLDGHTKFDINPLPSQAKADLLSQKKS